MLEDIYLVQEGLSLTYNIMYDLLISYYNNDKFYFEMIFVKKKIANH